MITINNTDTSPPQTTPSQLTTLSATTTPAPSAYTPQVSPAVRVVVVVLPLTQSFSLPSSAGVRGPASRGRVPTGGGSSGGGGRAQRWWKEGMEDRKCAVWTSRSHRSRATSSVGCAGQEKRWGTVWRSPLPHAVQEGSAVRPIAARKSFRAIQCPERSCDRVVR